MSTVLVYGNYGELVVHRVSGHILSYSTGGEVAAYEDIRWFDPTTLPDKGACDILSTGFASETGYVQALTWVGPGLCWVDRLYLPVPDVAVCLHGFYSDASGDSYSDNLEEITGWCVYLRRNYTQPSPNYAGDFDIDDEQDFTTYAEARTYATTRAAEYGITHQEY